MRKISKMLICLLLVFSIFLYGCSAKQVLEHPETSNVNTSILFNLKGQLYKADGSYLQNIKISLTLPDKTVYTADTDSAGSFSFPNIPVAQNISVSVLDSTGKELHASLLSIWPGYDLAYHNTSTTISLDMPDNTTAMFIVCKVDKNGKLVCSALNSETAPSSDATTAPDQSVAPSQSPKTQTMMVAKDNVKLRSEPSTNSQILATLNKNMLVVLLGESKKVGNYTWEKVTYTANNQTPVTGYIRADLLMQNTGKQ